MPKFGVLWYAAGGRARSAVTKWIAPSIRNPQSAAGRGACEISRFATRNMFEFHHIDGASQNKKQNLGSLRRQAWENPRGFSTGFAKKRQAPDPAKAGSMFYEHSAHSCSEPIFFLLLSQKLKQ